MTVEELTRDERHLLHRLESVDALHVLSLIRRDRVAWTAKMVAHALNMPEDTAAASLHTLSGAGIVMAGASDDERAYIYGPPSPTVADLCSRLIDLFRDDPLRVLRVLNEDALERARQAAIHVFMDPEEGSKS